MADALYTILNRLSADGAKRLLQRAGLHAPAGEDVSDRKRIKATLRAVQNATEIQKDQLDSIAGHIVSLSDLDELAELALRAVCEERRNLVPILESNSSLEERILKVSLLEPELLDQARNLAMTFHWKLGHRYSARFTVGRPIPMTNVISSVVQAIRRLVQKLHGGRKVHAEHFQYHAASETSERQFQIDHIAIYLETPARASMEFRAGSSVAAPIVRRVAKEMAIEYCPSTGELDVVGRGVGGTKVFREVAEAFCKHSLEGCELSELKHDEWPLGSFLREEQPQLTPPDGYRDARVVALVLRSKGANGGRAQFVAPFGGTAYDRMRQLGVQIGRGFNEWATELTLELTALAETEKQDERDLRVILRWPNQVSFEGAGVRDRQAITKWLRGPTFLRSA